MHIDPLVASQLSTSTVLELILRLANNGVITKSEGEEVIRYAIARLAPEHRGHAESIVRSALPNVDLNWPSD